MHTFLLIALLSYVSIVCISDVVSHRIPNVLTVPAAATAMTLSVASHGLSGALTSGAGLMVGLSLFLPFYLSGGFGAGDVKGLAAVGAFMGPYGVFLAALCTLIAGMVCGLGLLFVTGGWSAVRSMLGRWTFRAHVLFTTGRQAHIEADPGDPARRRFPYGFAIACGTAASVMLTLTR